MVETGGQGCLGAFSSGFGGIKSPVPHLLGTNHAPCATKVCDIRETIAQTTDGLSLINARMSALQDELNGLAAERDRMARFLNDHKALLSPIRRMPPEVMSEIFIHCLPVNDFIRPSAKKAPLLVSRICSMWRSIALSTPSLWCSLDMATNGFSDSDSGAAGMQVWLARSGACPLFLSLRDPYDNKGSWACLDIVIPHLWRCRKLYLDMRMEVLTAIPRKALPILESIEFGPWRSSMHWPGAWTGSSILDAFAMAPRLRSVATIWHHDIFSCAPCFPWSQLEDLSLHGITSLRESLDLLNHCRSLSTCSLSFACELEEPVPGPTVSLMVELLRLHTLTISPSDNDISDTIFDHLIVPALRHLDGDYLHVASSLINLLIRSRCQLKDLNLIFTEDEDFFSTTDDIRLLLEQTPSLVNLSISANLPDRFYWNNAVFESLTPGLTPGLSCDGEQSPCLIPKLEVLDVNFASDVFPSDDVVKDMLRSRLPSSRRGEDDSVVRPFPNMVSLKKAKIHFWHPTDTRLWRKWSITDTGDVVG